MKWLAILIITLPTLFSCGGGDVTVTYYTVSTEYMQTLCDNNCNGYAQWRTDAEGRSCSIYMYPMTTYRDEEEYHRVLGHEMRHCLTGVFH